jgi:nitrogen regulatory protein PII
MTTIVDRKIIEKYLSLYRENDLHIMYVTLGMGTATNEVMDYLGLDSAEKAVAFSVVEEETWQTVKKQLRKKLQIDAPGGGIAFTIPLSSVGGRKTLEFLLEKSDYQKQEESTLKNTEYELIVVISQQGYTDLIMDAARGAGAYGGTIIHAKGTGNAETEKFMGVTIAAEKEIIYIVSKAKEKNAIMKAIMEKAGSNTEAHGVLFSLPVDSVVGLKVFENLG